MASSERIDELKRKFDENPRRYFAPLANEFRKSGDLEQAILICQEFLPQQPGHMSGHIVYGQALYETGRIDEARGVFETALSLDPENLIALRHLGDIAARQGDPTSARRWYERVLEADPRNEEIQGLLASLESAPAAEAVAAAPAYSPPEPAAQVESRGFEHEPPAVSPAPPDEPELLDLDVAMPDDAGSIPVSAGTSAAAEPPVPGVFDPTTIDDIEATPETADLMPVTEGRAEGFEATEFSAPAGPVEQAEGLEAPFEVETGVHVAFFQTVSGLEVPKAAEEAPSTHTESSSFPELDEAMPEDHGEVLPPHGDPIAETAVAPTVTTRDESLLDFEMPIADMSAGAPTSASSDAVEASAGEEVASEDAPPSIPAELPPEVIAAEAELIDEGATPVPVDADASQEEPLDVESVGDEPSFIAVGGGEDIEPVVADTSSTSEELHAEAEAADETAAEPAPAEHRLFVTETMAELYLKQGLRPEALSVYEQLSSAAPGDERLARRVAALRAELATLAKASGPRVRDFFASFAVRRPGERAVASAPPADDDFGPNYTDEFPRPPASIRAVPPAVDRPTEAAPAAAADTPPERAGGSIDALFGNRPIGSVEDSAASALAQAFAAESESTPLAGNPTRPATGELTLDSVFREGPRGARAGQGFSFDQFFSQNVEGDKTSGGVSEEPPAGGEPAERSEDDIEQFNSWLQGLKQR
jgi:tetratricopeptide (TPR) repeat protein